MNKKLHGIILDFSCLKNLFFGFLLLLVLSPNGMFAQGNTCATATSLTINGACDTGTISDATQNAPNITGCAFSNFRREGWYTFTVTGGPLNITITANAANRGLYLQLISSTSSCTGLAEVTCQNADGANNTAQIETITTSLANGIYYVKVVNEGNNNDMVLNSICVTTPVASLANDNCTGAIPLTINTSCSYATYTTLGATPTTTPSTPPAPGCASYSGGDVWFSFTVPASGQVTVDTQSGGMTDSGMAWYTGTCGTLTLLECDDDDSANGLMSLITRTGLTPGSTIYVRIWEYSNDNQGTFGICATSPGPCTTPVAQASGFTPGTITSNAFPATFTGTADGFLVIRSTSATPPTQPVNGVVYTAGNIATLGAGLTLVQNGASTTIAGTGLTGNTRYYYYIYAYNNTNCSGGPLYNTSGALTGNAVTCPATPAPVTTSSTLTSVNFSWPSSIGGGSNAVTYQLQVTTNAAYTANVPGSPFTINDPTTIYNLTGLTANTTYYYRIRANNGCWSTYSTGIVVTGYCVANNSTNTTYYISGVTTTGGVANINNTPTGFTAGGYANYTAMVVSQNAGLNFNITARHPSSTYGYTVWVDWNNDLDFNDPGETVISTDYLATPAAIGSVTIPGGTPAGDYRMRIRNAWLSNPAPSCGNFAYGEAEDYTVRCLGPLPCSGNPSSIVVNVLSLSTADVTWTAATPAPANGYQYYLSTTNTSPLAGTAPTGSVGAGVTTINLTGLTSATTYYIWIRSNCGGGLGQGAWIGPVSFYIPNCSFGSGTGTTSVGCPTSTSGGLGLGGVDAPPIDCSTAACVDLEVEFTDIKRTTSYTVASIAYAPPYQFDCLRNPVSVNTDDVWSPVINLPFNFCFYGSTYNSCVIGSNGILTFDVANAGNYAGYSFSNNLPSTVGALFANSIYGVYHDIDPSVAGGEVGWELITLNTGCQALVASWNNVAMFSNNTIKYTGMMVLYENTNVIEVYIKEKRIDGTWNGGNAIVGLQNAAGTAATVAPGRNGLDADWTVTNEAWRFTPNGASVPSSIKWYEGNGTAGAVVGTTPVINVCPTTTTDYTAEITYTLCSGLVYTSTDVTTVTVSTDKTWNGSISTDWNNPLNWTPIGLPSAAHSVAIPNVANDPIIGIGLNALACSVNVQSGAVLTINSGRNMTVTNGITVAAGGTFDVKNSANLVQVNNAAINAGNINMERITNVRLQDYSYWSSPVNTFPVQSVSPSTPSGYIFEWGTTTPNANGGQGTWVNTSENMIPAKGYILRAPNGFTNGATSALTANFIGVPNNGIFTPSIFRGTDFTGLGTQSIPRTITDDNWSLIGNPYPSSIGVKEFISLPANSSIVGGVRVWTHGQLPTNAVDPFYQNFVTNYYPSDYVTINLVGATSGPGDPTIGAGQGFMVLMGAGAPGSSTVTFNNSMRSASFGNNVFYRNSNASNTTNTVEQNRIWLDLVSSSGAVNRMLVGYVTDATQAEDFLYDSFTDYKPSQNFYSLIGNDPMAIQGRVLPFDVNDRVNLGVTIPQDGMYSIAIAALDGLFETTNQDIYIEDLENNIIHSLRDMPYSFMAVAGNNTNRFILRYTDSRLGTDDLENLNNNVFVVANDNLSVKSTSIAIKSVTIHDVLGRIISNKNNVNLNEVSFGNIQKNNTTLLVRIELTNGAIVNKKVIF